MQNIIYFLQVYICEHRCKEKHQEKDVLYEKKQYFQTGKGIKDWYSTFIHNILLFYKNIYLHNLKLFKL